MARLAPTLLSGPPAPRLQCGLLHQAEGVALVAGVAGLHEAEPLVTMEAAKTKKEKKRQRKIPRTMMLRMEKTKKK